MNNMNTNLKLKVLASLKSYSETQKGLRQSLKNVIVKNYKTNISDAFEKWTKYAKKRQEIATLILRNEEQLEVHKADKFKNDEISRLQSMKSGQVKLNDRLYKQCKRTFSNFFNRMVSFHMKRGFQIWKEKSMKLKHIETVIAKLGNHLNTHSHALTVAKWKIWVDKTKAIDVKFELDCQTNESKKLNYQRDAQNKEISGKLSKLETYKTERSTN